MIAALVRLAPALLIAFLSTGFAPAQGDPYRDADLEALGTSLQAYLQARTDALNVDEALADTAARLSALQSSTGGEDPLRDHGALRRALRLARDIDAAKLAKGKIQEEVFENGSFEGNGLEMTYRLPKDYEPDERDYPLFLAIPDAGETPGAHLRSHWMAREIRRGAIVVCFPMPEAVEGWDRVIVRGRPGGLAHVLSALRFATERFAVDSDRIYVSGHGEGARAALATGNYVPQRLAGVIVRSGDVSDPQEQDPESPALGNFQNLPICIAGEGENADAFVAAANRGDGARAERLQQDDDVALWMWTLDHPRVAFPDRVRIVTGRTNAAALTSMYPFPTRAHWMQIAPSAPGANATARIDRQRNAIEVAAEGASHVTLYLNDALIDLDRALVVTCNGVERTLQPQRHLSSMLDMLFDGTSDPGCLYVTRTSFETASEASAGQAAIPGPDDQTFRDRLDQAGQEAAALWDLHQACREDGRDRDARTALRRLLRLHPDHAEGRAAAGQFGADGQWFATQVAYERHLRSQDEANAAAKGYVFHKGAFLHPDERSLANKGQMKDFATGQWLRKSDLRRLSEGWTRQDRAWIPPAEAHHVDEGLWRVDGDWIEMSAANRRHARIGSMWRIPCGEVELFTTVDRDVALQAAEHMGRAIEDLQRVFGAQPPLPLPVALLRDEAQYDRFAFGEPDGRRRPTHTGRLHVIHNAYFAESWFPRAAGKTIWRGMGVGLWDAIAPNGNLYGVHAARLAVGLSYVDALDPSPKAVRRALSRGREGFYEAFQEEKALPAWLRYGGAVYAERYFRDRTVADDADPWWARAWSLDNLSRAGGLRPLDEVFVFALDPEDRANGQKLLLEAGLLIAFVVDGNCTPVKEQHEKLKRALVTGSLHPKHVRALKQAIAEHESELHAFAGL